MAMSSADLLFGTAGNYDTREAKDIFQNELSALYAAQSHTMADINLDEDAADNQLRLMAQAIRASVFRAALRGCKNITQIKENARNLPFSVEADRKFLN